MSAADQRGRQGPEVGLLEWFWLNDYRRVEEAIVDLRRLGVQHLRIGFSWADYMRPDGQAWYDWLIPLLAREVELLPCFVYTPPSLGEVPSTAAPPREPKAYADFLDYCITRYGRHFDTVELWNEPNNIREWDCERDPHWTKFAATIKGAAHWARQRGKRTVLGGMSPVDQNWLNTMNRLGVLDYMDVVGLHAFPGSYDADSRPISENVRRIREQLDHYGRDASIWITEVGYPTWRHDEFRQLQVLADVLSQPVERVYWLCLQDLAPERPSLAGFHVDPRDYHFGIKTAQGRQKLLYRCWAERGLAGVCEMANWTTSRPTTGGRSCTLITGGAGFVGSNLAARLAGQGRRVRILDNLSRPGVDRNLEWLRRRFGDRIEFLAGDMRDALVVERAVAGCSQVFHLAAQVAVTTSLHDPRQDFEINLLGSLNLLEAARAQPQPPGIIFTSTNKVYGELPGIPLREAESRYQPADDAIAKYGICENQALDFHSPYGCSKGGADQYMLDYARSLGVPAVVFRMSCIYGPGQFGTEDQGWVAHFLIRARKREPITIYGDGKQVRDILFVSDLVAAFELAERHMHRLTGRAFNIGGGSENAVSLLEFVDRISQLREARPQVEFAEWRTGDQLYYVSDTRSFRRMTGWRPRVRPNEGILRLDAWLKRALLPQEQHGEAAS